MARVSKVKIYFDIIKGLVTRLLFLLHGALSLYLLYRSNNFTDIHILFAIPMVALLLEGIITICVRKGKELKYFWPCGFLYIATIVPMIWVLELDLLQTRQGLGSKNFTTNITQEKGIDELVLEALRISDLDARKFCEIGVMIGLIVGRWLSPRTFLSRNQLSALLLGYVSNAADILELFESLKAPNSKIVFHSAVTYGILAVYTWALLQFAFVTTATPSWKDQGSNKIGPTHKVHDGMGRGPGDPDSNTARYGKMNSVSPHQNSNTERERPCCNCFKFHPEHFQILVTLIMQDGPFLILRLFMSIQFQFVTELHIFFLCKNAVVCVLLLHRLFVLAFDDDEIDADDEYEVDSEPNDTALEARPTSRGNDNIGIDNTLPDEKRE